MLLWIKKKQKKNNIKQEYRESLIQEKMYTQGN